MPGSNKVLIITYYWPPSGGAGVQRWLKFSKYLPEFGWTPIILTVDPEYAEYPAWDKSLESDINSGLIVVKTRAKNYFRIFSGKQKGKGNSQLKAKSFGIANFLARFIRGNFFIPDPRIGWNKFAYKKAEQLIADEGIGQIITTGPPHSTHLIGRRLKRKNPDLKWTADFRDPWTDIYYYKDFYGTPPAIKKDKNYERSVLSEADAILTIGDGMKGLLESKIQSENKKVYSLPNGYDEEDFTNIELMDDGSSFVITYVGSVSDQYPLKTFLQALSSIVKSNPDRNILLRFVGHVTPVMVDLIRESGLIDITSFIEYSNHKDAINYIASGDILLLLIPNHKLSSVIVTGKLFEYLRSGNRILGIGPGEGDAARIVYDSGRGIFVEPTDNNSIKEFLISELSKDDLKVKDAKIEKFERRALTSKLNELLNT